MMKPAKLPVLNALSVWFYWDDPDAYTAGVAMITDDYGNLVPTDLDKLHSFVWGSAC
jgi:hypothetical protein